MNNEDAFVNDYWWHFDRFCDHWEALAFALDEMRLRM